MNEHVPQPVPGLSEFPVTHRWPAQHPDWVQLYSRPTPNGVKVSIALEELEIPYEAHPLRLTAEDVKSPEFLSLNPNGKIPAIIDPDGPDGKPIGIFESGAILIYLAEKTGRLWGNTARDRHMITQWLMFQMGAIGPFFGQLGYFHASEGREIEDPRPRQRYIDETRRLLGVLEGALENQEWIAGAYSIADIAIAPWVRVLDTGYDALGVVEFDNYPNVDDYLDRFLERPAVQRGLVRPPRI